MMAMIGSFWDATNVVLGLGAMALIWFALVLLDELFVRFSARRAVRRITDDSGPTGPRTRVRHSLR